MPVGDGDCDRRVMLFLGGLLRDAGRQTGLRASVGSRSIRRLCQPTSDRNGQIGTGRPPPRSGQRLRKATADPTHRHRRSQRGAPARRCGQSVGDEFSYTLDVLSSLDRSGAASADWTGYWGKQAPTLFEHRLALYEKEQRLVFGAHTYRLFAQMLASSAKASDVRDPWVTRMRSPPTTVVSTTTSSLG